jgi:acetyltransferase-like isoleucine patch superfamily enzyme
MMYEVINTPWKVFNEWARFCAYPWVRLCFVLNRIPWGGDFKFYGVPIVQKHRQSTMLFGRGLQLRSTLYANPLGINHPVILATFKKGAILKVGDYFSMSGGSICASEKVIIGNHVAIGANSTIVDSDFHPIQPDIRQDKPREGLSKPVIIEDDVFIGMGCLILKGVKIGQGCVIGAGSVVSRDVPPGVIAAGNPAVPIREI